MSNVQKISNNIVTIQDIDPSVYSALKNSIYPGASDESIILVVNYCLAAKLDPMLKPVHIVSMSVKDPVTKKYVKRDVVMRGVGLYRIQAQRTGEYFGLSEPEFGPDITEKVGNITMTYPLWCKITVKRLVQGRIAKFPVIERWKENYATKGKDWNAGGIDDLTPNAMWQKRPYAQLAKCAEAQSLRKGFPELGQQPTAEEMEGKVLMMDEYMDLLERRPKSEPQKTYAHTGDAIKAKLKPQAKAIEMEGVVDHATPEQIGELMELVELTGSTEALTDKWKKAAGVEALEDLPGQHMDRCIGLLRSRLTSNQANVG